MERYGEALTFLRRSMKMFEHLGDVSQLTGSLIHVSELHQRMLDFDESRQSALRALDLAVDSGNETLIGEAREHLKKLALTQMQPAPSDREKVVKGLVRVPQKVVRLDDYRGPNSGS
jgi:hypothetical protein